MNTRDFEKLLELFDLDPDFTEGQLKSSYKELVQIWHPDRFLHNPKLKQKAEEKMKDINNSYQILLDYLKNADLESQEEQNESDNFDYKEAHKEDVNHKNNNDQGVNVSKVNKKWNYLLRFGILFLIVLFFRVCYWMVSEKEGAKLTSPKFVPVEEPQPPNKVLKEEEKKIPKFNPVPVEEEPENPFMALPDEEEPQPTQKPRRRVENPFEEFLPTKEFPTSLLEIKHDGLTYNYLEGLILNPVFKGFIFNKSESDTATDIVVRLYLYKGSSLVDTKEVLLKENDSPMDINPKFVKTFEIPLSGVYEGAVTKLEYKIISARKVVTHK